jgi:hypothetical protein
MGLARRLWLPTLIVPLTALIMSCDGGGGDEGGNKNPIKPPTPVSNVLPNTEILHYNGWVRHTFPGTDTDGTIDYIHVKYGTGSALNVSNNSTRSVPIVSGENSVEATAYDNDGGADPTPAKYTFISPTESQAASAIISVLNSRSSTYQSFTQNALLSLGESASFPVDFLITLNDGTNAVIEYINHSESLTEAAARQAVLAVYGISNISFPRFPTDEIRSRLNDFLNNL